MKKIIMAFLTLFYLTGDEASARNIRFLHRMGITHVLNAAQGVWTDCSFVDLTPEYYAGSGINYQGFELWDSNQMKILPFFGCANEFILSAMKSGGKCLVHCQMGVSRSCALAMAYMMLTEGWDAADVMREFRKRRDVRPNDYFLSQIVELDNELRKERLFGIPRSIKLCSLGNAHKLPKPWHYELWNVPPEQNTVPFKLVHMGDPGSEKYVANAMEDEEGEKPKQKLRSRSRERSMARGKTPFTKTSDSSESEYEWEYYYDEE